MHMSTLRKVGCFIFLSCAFAIVGCDGASAVAPDDDTAKSDFFEKELPKGDYRLIEPIEPKADKQPGSVLYLLMIKDKNQFEACVDKKCQAAVAGSYELKK